MTLEISEGWMLLCLPKTHEKPASNEHPSVDAGDHCESGVSNVEHNILFLEPVKSIRTLNDSTDDQDNDSDRDTDFSPQQICNIWCCTFQSN
jgi:hypothetical protein